ncbi:polysaccharide lyase family 7 protein [Vibrio hippocampi]|uniref:Alginate lyase n=1 Tax=Vibrio hippocampi TaxID=654686 RepID=A0ABN8DIW6_9VIBR|nr:polysaccharide lyase family 7 protein [Vibrio hippocampi]CAH0526513.1 Alginate lyase [Vibrio hippocampi]
MKKLQLTLLTASIIAGSAMAATPAETAKQFNLDATKAPSQNFDLTKWKINLPTLETQGARKGKTVEIPKQELGDTKKPFSDPEWFYTNKETGAMVFVAPNTAPTTPNSKNARSELRAMLAVDYGEPANNFVVASHPDAKSYGAIGGQMSATLAVDHVSESGNDKKSGAFSVVVGQIHAAKNEPLKIFYRKLPGHETGSLYWSYELNVSKENHNARDENGKKLRKDIYHNVFGTKGLRHDAAAPTDGIKLGEIFAYDVNVEGDIMHLTFTKNPSSSAKVVKTFDIDLTAGNYQGNSADLGYGNTWMYYKAGAYNQCNTKKSSSACEWRGMEAGDYAQVSFYQLDLKQ